MGLAGSVACRCVPGERNEVKSESARFCLGDVPSRAPPWRGGPSGPSGSLGSRSGLKLSLGFVVGIPWRRAVGGRDGPALMARPGVGSGKAKLRAALEFLFGYARYAILRRRLGRCRSRPSREDQDTDERRDFISSREGQGGGRVSPSSIRCDWGLESSGGVEDGCHGAWAPSTSPPSTSLRERR